MVGVFVCGLACGPSTGQPPSAWVGSGAPAAASAGQASQASREEGTQQEQKQEQKQEQAKKSAASQETAVESSAQPGKSTRDGEESRVYTNEDLERLFGPAPPPRKETEAPVGKPGESVPGTEALKQIQEEQAREVTRERLRSEAGKRVETAQARVRRLEDRLLRLRNPFLPRPEADMTEEELEAWKGLDSAARVRLTEKELEEARRELEKAQQALRTLEGGGPGS